MSYIQKMFNFYDSAEETKQPIPFPSRPAQAETLELPMEEPQPEMAERPKPETKTLPTVKEWTCTAGPRKSKHVIELIKKLDWRKKDTKSLWGVKGVTESSSITSILFGGICNPSAIEEMAKVGEKYNWLVTNDNLESLAADLKTAYENATAKMPVEDRRTTPEEDAGRKAEMDAKHKVMEEEDAKDKAQWDAIKAKAPANACAVIVAELRVNDSDLTTDYFASHSTRRIAIGFRTGRKEDFRQLRGAAELHPETAHMGTGKNVWSAYIYYQSPDERMEQNQRIDSIEHDGTRDEFDKILAEKLLETTELNSDGWSRKVDISEKDIEKRENYSMGAGNYLGHSNYDGWIVKSYLLENDYHNGIEDATGPWLERRGQPHGNQSKANGSNANETVAGKASIQENEKFGGIEVVFNGVPGEEAKAALKESGFRYHKEKKLWFAKKSEKTETAAKKAVEIHNMATAS